MNLSQLNIAVIKSRLANLYSVQNALVSLGAHPHITNVPEEIFKSDVVIFPGVGSFAQVMEELDSSGMSQVVKTVASSGKPFLGICLGMQILFEKGHEGDEPCAGLGLLEGEVIPIPREIVSRVPHIGWNSLKVNPLHKNNSLFYEQAASSQVYFVHSFYCSAKDSKEVVAYTELAEGFEVPVIVQKQNIAGMQFHPERSGKVGLKFLNNFLQSCL